MPALVLLGRQLLIASDDVPLFALPAALFHSGWTVVLVVTLALYQRHPICRDEGDYLPFLAGGAAAFVISSALEWSLFKVGLTGTPLETHARRAVPLLLYLHTFASISELGFAAYGAHLLRVDTRLCIAWSPRPLAAALVGTTWAVIALNGLLTALALNPWHGLGLVEAWEARLLWLSRLLCCRSGLLTQARVPDREPALRRIAQLTSHLLQHVDLTLSDVAAAMILVAAAQRERRRRALRDAMVAAAAAHAALLGSGAAAASSAAPFGPGFVPGIGSGLMLGGGSGVVSDSVYGDAPAEPKASGGSPGRGSSGGAVGGAGTAAPAAAPAAAAAVAALHGSDMGGSAPVTAASSQSPFLTVQQPQTPQHPQQHPHPPAGAHPGRQTRVRFVDDGTELGPLHVRSPSPPPPPPPPAPLPVSPAEATLRRTEASHGSCGVARVVSADSPSVHDGHCGGMNCGTTTTTATNTSTAATATSTATNGGVSLVALPTTTATAILTGMVVAGSDKGSAGSVQQCPVGGAAAKPGAVAAADGGSSSSSGSASGSRLGLLGATAGGELTPQPPSPSRALTLMHPMVHITPAGMEEHLDELVGELVGELAAEVAEAEADVGPPTGRTDGSRDLDLILDLDLQEKREDPASTEMDSRRLGSAGAAVAAVAATAAAAAVVATTSAATTAAAAEAPGPPPLGVPRRPPAPLPPSAMLALRKRIGEAALAAAFAAEREMVDRETLQEAALYGRYAAAIYGSCPPDGPSDAAAWHLGGDGDPGSSLDQVAAWRRRHGSSAPDPLLASILSSASKCTEHVVHVNTHNSTEGYLPYMVCLDKPTRSVVIAIRGTFSAEDIVTDCLCEPVDVRHMLTPPRLAPDTTTAAMSPSPSLSAAAASCGAAAAAAGAADPLLSSMVGGEVEVEGAVAVAAAAAAAALNAALVGVPLDEPVLVHAGIWAAAEVIWEDLTQLRLMDILLPPPGPSSCPAAAAATTTAGEQRAPAPAAATSATNPASISTSASASVTSSSSSSRDISQPGSNAVGGVTGAPPPSVGVSGAPPDHHHHLYPPNSRNQQEQIARQQQEPPAQQPQLQPQLQMPRTRMAPPPQPLSPQYQPQQPQQRWRPSSFDEGRIAALGTLPTHQLAAPPPAAYGACASGAGGTDPWVASAALSPLEISRRLSNMPRLISAERQATAPHGTGLGALLRRHQRQPPPPPPPAAALLPSLVLSYIPPPRTASMPPSAGAARSRRDFLQSALRRGKSTSAAAAGGGGSSGSRRRRRRGGTNAGSSGRSSGADASGGGDDDDNDPRAPLLLPPSVPPVGAGPTAIAGPPAAPLATTAAGFYSPAVAHPQPPHLLTGRSRTSPPHEAVRQLSTVIGFAAWRAGAGGAAADSDRGLGVGTSPSRLATDRSAGPPSSLLPLPAAAGRRPFHPAYSHPKPEPSLPPQGGLGTAPGAAASTSATCPSTSSPYYNRMQGSASRLRSRDDMSGAVGCATDSPSGREAPATASGTGSDGAAPGVVGRVRQVASEILHAASDLLLSLPRPGARSPLLPLQQRQQGTQTQAQRQQRRLGWFGVYGHAGGLRSASDGGAQLPYSSLPRTEAEAEVQAGGGGGGGGAGVTGSFDQLGRRWRSAGGVAATATGDCGGVLNDWSLIGSHLHSPLDVEAATAAAAAAVVTPDGSGEAQGLPTAGAANTAPSPAPPPPPLRLPEVDCSGWRLVVTGHSLGAGAAALLALRLRSALPHVEVRCWAFAPPGSLTSPSLSAALRPFTTSVVTGKDLIPRLSLNTMERYRDEMITALARCRCSKARVLVGSFSRRNRLRRAAHLLLPYDEIPAQARRLLRSYHEAVHRAGRLPELHPPGRILYLQPSARAASVDNKDDARGGHPHGPRRAPGASGGGGGEVPRGPPPPPCPHFRPVWVSARELHCEGILASTRMLVDHSLTMCTLPALDEILGS